MLALRIIATVVMALSCITPLDEKLMSYKLFGLAWRAFVIVALWLI